MADSAGWYHQIQSHYFS